MAEENVPGRGLAIGSLVCGIVAIVTMFVYPLSLVAVIVGIVGLILGIKANKLQKQGMATAGIVMSVIGLIAGALFFVGCTVCAVLGAKALQEVDWGELSSQLSEENLSDIQDALESLKSLGE